MADVKNGSLVTIYRAGMLVLFALLCFIGTRVYNTVDMLPKEYVTMERYKCDIERIEKTIMSMNSSMQIGFSEIKTEIRSINKQ